MNVSLTLWLVAIGAILVLVALDFLTVSRKPHEVSFKEAAWWSIFYIGVAIAFGVVVWCMSGSDYGTQYFAAYLVEKSLSVDNLFVFVIILTQFAVPSIYHQRVLLVGVVLALVLRAIFIAVGAAALAAFAFTFVIFGAILIWTGVQLFRHRNADPEPKDNLVVRTFRRWYPVTEDYHETKLFVRIDGKRMATPLLLVMVAIASTDLLFALDSIPATFGVTQEPYLVFTANAAALLGLRALYFLLRGLLDKLIYLSLGLSLILIFIGVKLILTFFHETYPVVPKIPTLFSLGVIAAILVIVTVASWIKVRRDPTAIAHAGTVTKPKHQEGDATP
ncbi:MAG: TerC/Alx family metal homeostasis membrane protein [Actinobacteria bacterium]|nr:TerC/Alx family metal homeostasis membrane protein [Actinomycetota bacterium]